MNQPELDQEADELFSEKSPLEILAEEHQPWEERNFPNAKPYWGFIGLCEEFGELCHARLKMEQGIRGHEDLKAREIDAVGDMMIFAQSVRNVLEDWLAGLRTNSEVEVPRRIDHIMYMALIIGEISELIAREEPKMALYALDTRLAWKMRDYCASVNIDFDEAVKKTWAKVKKRDWQRDRFRGNPDFDPSTLTEVGRGERFEEVNG